MDAFTWWLMVGLLAGLLLLALVLLAALASLVLASLTGAPFVPAGRAVTQRMVELAQPRVGGRAVDLGSGDGRLVLALAGQGALAEGYEIQPFLVWWSRFRAFWYARRAVRTGRLFGSARFYCRNLWYADCRGADVVTLYAFPSMMGRLQRKLQAELSPGARVVSLAFPFPGWQPVRQEGKIYVYEK